MQRNCSIETTMNTRRLGFIKRSPCSRATRIRLRVHQPSRPKQNSSTEIRNTFQSLVALLTQSTLRTEERFRHLYSLMEKLPPWTEWTSKDDAMFGPVVGEFPSRGLLSRAASPSPEEDTKLDVAVPEEMLADSLIQLNGNCTYLRDIDLDRCDGGFCSMFINWLRANCSPGDAQAHVRDEDGLWLQDDVVRQRLKEGFVIHIPTRTLQRQQDEYPRSVHVNPLFSSPTRPRRGALVKEENDDQY